MRSADSSSPQVRVLAEHISDHLSVFVVAENTDAERPANGGLRLLSYDSDATCKADGHRLANVEAPLPAGADEMPGVIVPRKAVTELRKLIDESGDEEAQDFAIGPNG